MRLTTPDVSVSQRSARPRRPAYLLAATLLLATATACGGASAPAASPTGRGTSIGSPPPSASPSTPAATSAAPAPRTASPSTSPTATTTLQSPGASGSHAPGSPTAAATGPTTGGLDLSCPTGDFPITLTDDEENEVTIERRPEKVVSLTPANTETVFALGAGEKVVGGTDADDYPAEAKELPDVATFNGVLVEKVIELDPDVVLAGGNEFNPPAQLDRLRSAGIPVVVLYAETVDEVLKDIHLIGRSIGACERAADVARDIQARMDAIEQAARTTGTRPRTFYEISAEQEIYGPADGSFIADMVERAGGDPITTGDPGRFSIPLETLVTADPEVIVLGDANYGATPEAVAARPGGWARMTAVRTGAVRPIDDVIVTRPGPRLADGLAALAKAIHPDVAVPPPPSTVPSPSAVASP